MCVSTANLQSVFDKVHSRHSQASLDMQLLEQSADVRAALKRVAATSNKPGPDACLPETMPAGALLTPYLQSLQRALVPFQVGAPFVSLLSALPL